MALADLQVSSVAAPLPVAAANRNPFLFSAGGKTLDLYPVIRDGANLNLIRARIKHHTADDLTKYTAVYHRLRRFLIRLENEEYLVSAKGVQDLGLDEKPSVWWRPTQKALTCLGQVQNSNLCKLPRDPNTLEDDTLQRQMSRGTFRTRYPHEEAEDPGQKIPKWVRFPKRTSLTRLKAASLLCQVRNDYLPDLGQRLFERIDTGRLNPKTGEPVRVVNPLLKAKLAEVRDYYNYYLEEIEDKQIVLVNKDAECPAAEDFKTIPYRTRFNDFSRSARALDRYEAAWAEAEKHHSSAVFVTLTTDPKMHATLWRANRHMGVAWNRYMSLLAKRARDGFVKDLRDTKAKILKKDGYTAPEIETLLSSDEFQQYVDHELEGKSFRPKYIAVNEFMENGLLHLHIVMFGISWLAKKAQISEDWERCGQGKIVDAVAIRKNERTGIWEWSGHRPQDAKQGETPKDYLKKYLHKAIQDRRGFELYWAVNKKFFSCSRRFSPTPLTAEEEVELWFQKINEKLIKEAAPTYWRHAFCCKSGDLPTWMAWYDRRNRRNVRPPPVLTENILPTVPPLMLANDRRIEHLRRRGLLKFRTARELRRLDAAERSGPEKNPETGRPWSLADFM